MDPAKQIQLASLQGSESVAGMRSSSAQRSYKTPPMPWGLMEFYGGEQPWVPPGIFPESQQGRHVNASGIQRRGNPGGFNGWRSNLPSECDTVPPGFPPSDSGYESRTKQSIENTSVFNDVDRSQDTQSLSGHMMDFQPFGLTPSDAPWNLATTPIQIAHNGTVDQKLRCPDCKALCKTKSELNKHNQRHRKAFKCAVIGCARKEGFGTLNDLDRHRSSVHPGEFNGGQRYRCRRGPCQTKEKIWPRADNFRQHLKRVHRMSVTPEDDLSDYVVQQASQNSQEDSSRQNSHADLEGVGSDLFPSFNEGSMMAWDGRSPALEDVQLSPPEQSMSMDLILDPSLTSSDEPTSNAPLEQSTVGMAVAQTQPKDQDSNQAVKDYANPVYGPLQTHHEYVQPGEISKGVPPKSVVVGQIHLRSDGLHMIQSQHSAVRPSMNYEGDAPISATSRKQFVERSSVTRMDCDTIPNGPLDRIPADSSPEDQSVDREMIKEDRAMSQSPSICSKEELNEQAMLKVLSKMPKSLIESYLMAQAENPPEKPNTTLIGNPDSQHQCPHSNCTKAFNRKCELKKHMKRHEKPYGCTFAGCKKKFGSKNDWKRHENSQHFQLEVWKCLEKRTEDDSESCGKVCHRRETFRNHLQKEHRMEDTAQVDKALEKCRVGRNCESRFWCGFCVKIIEITKKDVNAWTERFNHIDKHYSGRDNSSKKEISEWRNVDPEIAEGDFTGSPDDSSDADSGDYSYTVVDSRKTPITDRGSHTQSRKRRLDDDEGQRDSKRAKENPTYMWYCCKCRWDADIKLHVACINCSHVRCEYCVVEGHQTLQDKDN